MLCEHTEESQSPLDTCQFQDRQDQEKETLRSQEGPVLESISGTQAPHTQCVESTTHLPCALNASDDTQVHSCPAGHQAEEQLPLDSACVADVRCDVQSLPVPEVAHSATALALLHKSWSQEYCYRLASESGDNPRHSLTTTHELQPPARQTLHSLELP